jgi:hypothetical protein
MTDIVQKLWGFCHALRHDGIGYTEYVEQLTYLLFIKMADEKGIDLSRTEVEETADDGKKRKRIVDCSWPALRDTSGTEIIDRYIDILRALGKQAGTLGSIFAGAQSRFTKPVSLKTLINRIDETEWTTLGVGVKAAAYEGLLEKAASEGKKGAASCSPRACSSSRLYDASNPIRAAARTSPSAIRPAARAAFWSRPTNGSFIRPRAARWTVAKPAASARTPISVKTSMPRLAGWR